MAVAAPACLPEQTRSYGNVETDDEGPGPVAPVDASKADSPSAPADAAPPPPEASPCAVCLPQATCQARGETATCQCPAGFAGDGTIAGTGCNDVDECSGSNGCVAPGSGGACTNTAGSYTCGCQPGFVGDGKASGTGCTDVDECSGANDCVAGQAGGACANVPGGYTCACQPGYSGDGKTSGTGCSDVDECAGGSGCVAPEAGGACANTVGGFTCSCQSGYQGDGKISGSGCTDIDECASSGNECESPLWGGACTNVVGGYTCGCQPGYAGDGKWAGTGCTDIDECAGSNDCASGAAGGACSNVLGGYTCACQPGFVGDGKVSGTGCTDIDECSGTNDCVAANANGTCSNTAGGYTCGCTAPYSGDGKTTGKGCQWLPDLLWYRFDGETQYVENSATNPPLGAETAIIHGAETQAGAGQCLRALVGTGNTSTNDYVETGWATNLSGSWTISFWTSNITPSPTLFYIFGDTSANSFRCFTNGVAGANNWILRGGGLDDVLAPGAATVDAAVTTFVYDATVAEVRAYVNGALVNTVAQPPLSIVGSAFKLGYGTNIALPEGGLMDEYRVYSVALPASEVAKLAQTAEVCK
ncbi:PE family protein [Labilithrix luteola]|uniref:PE family protein n=1 Tax=Labilithrix luteola TaxID=1391654 RepID=A0A0K1PZ49_9BACT|nr:LamG-like jellyroll fold domain-containing protein [Labilithrix luteola]AKU98805.1 PE family protein [Labilithrix luteola]